jgi:type IV secretion system protein VirB6
MRGKNRIMTYIRSFFIIMILSVQLIAPARGSSERFNWMDTNISALGGLYGCIEVPQFASVHQGSQLLDLDQTGQWVSTGIRVDNGKLLQFEWSTKAVVPRPDKYKVMYRIDPRFSMPQVFIQKFDFATGRFISDFHQFKGGQLISYQGTPEMTFEQRIIDYTDYFKFNGRSKIPVKINDVINVTLDNSGSFFGSTSEFNTEQGIGADLLLIYSATTQPTNSIFYSNARQFCNHAIGPASANYVTNCLAFPDLYWDAGINWSTFLGKINNSDVSQTELANLPSCPDAANGMDNDPICNYDMGRGMIFSVGGTTIKSETEKFLRSPFTTKEFYYHKSDVDGDLEFKSPWDIASMYNGSDQLMENWRSLPITPDYDAFNAYMTLVKPGLSMNFLYMGRYLMDIEIGNSIVGASAENLESVEVEYYISETAIPNSGTSGTSVGREYRGNANATGYLWLRVVNPNPELTGKIQVKTANYTGTTWVSGVIYYELVKPLRDRFNELSEVIYRKLIGNPAVQNIAKTMLVIYIILYGLTFLAGATQITTTDIVIRVLKIGLIIALFSDTSWTFFNDNLFNVFIEGTEYLMNATVGTTSTAGNIFGFIDPVVEKYINERVWQLLLIQLLQFHNGLTIFALMTIYSILIFAKAVLQIVIGYCLAFLSLAVMISLAPFFITFVLFERTKSMFDNWLSTMFGYMMQPTILLIFILLIDQVLGEVVLKTIVRACWGTLTPIVIGMDLNHMSIPISFSFQIPFLSEIPFFVPDVKGVGSMQDFFFDPGTFSMLITSSFLFLALCRLADGLAEYVGVLVPMLTQTAPARQDGKQQSSANPINDITNDLGSVTKPVTGAFKSIGSAAVGAGVGAVRSGNRAVLKGVFGGVKLAKSKLLDQKISDKNSSEGTGGEINYSKVAKTDNSSDPLKMESRSWGKSNLETGGGKTSVSGLTPKSTGFKDVTNEKTDTKSKLEKLKTEDIKSNNKSEDGVSRQGVRKYESDAQISSKKGGSLDNQTNIENQDIGAHSKDARVNPMSEGNQENVPRQDFTQPKSEDKSGDSSGGFDNSSHSNGSDSSTITRNDLERSTNTENDQGKLQKDDSQEKQISSEDTKEPDVSPKKEDAKIERKSSAKLKGDDE